MHEKNGPAKSQRRAERKPRSSSGANRREHVQKIISLLDEWMKDESGYDEKTWPELKQALERDRLSSRRLFHG